MPKTKNRFCKTCDRVMPHDVESLHNPAAKAMASVATLGMVNLFSKLGGNGFYTKVWTCQRCGRETDIG